MCDCEALHRVRFNAALNEEAASRARLQREEALLNPISIVFDGPPSHEAGRFVEVEQNGKGIGVGEWKERPDGLWELVIPAVVTGPQR